MKTYTVAIVMVFACSSFTTLQHTSTQENEGRLLFERYCTKCHGRDGTKGMFRAKNLQMSKLDDTSLQNIILQGKRWMPSWKKKLQPDEVRSVMDYIKTLRK